MSTSKRVLLIGLSQVPKVGPQEIIAEGLNHGQERINESVAKACAAGYETEAYLTLPDELDTFPLRVKEKLQSEKWDALIVGFGLRGVPEHTEAFEKLVRIALEVVPNIQLGFNTRPDDVHEAVFRLPASSV